MIFPIALQKLAYWNDRTASAMIKAFVNQATPSWCSNYNDLIGFATGPRWPSQDLARKQRKMGQVKGGKLFWGEQVYPQKMGLGEHFGGKKMQCLGHKRQQHYKMWAVSSLAWLQTIYSNSVGAHKKIP